MKFFTSSLLALALASGAFALPRPEVDFVYRVKESITAPPGWRKVIDAPTGHIIDLRIGLPHSNFDELERHLYEISDPTHSRYGQHLSKAQVEELITPKKESLDLVDEWLASHGIGKDDCSRSSAKDWVIVKVPIGVAEKMLNTKYHVWKYEDSDDHLIRTTGYSLPSFLDGHVDLIQPTTLFTRWKTMKSTIHLGKTSFFKDTIPQVLGGGGPESSCSQNITIECLQDLYNFKDYKAQASDKNAIGISSYLGEFINNNDLQTFYKAQRPDAVGSTYKLISVKGGQNNQDVEAAGAEANLDAQVAFGLTYPTQRVAWTTAGSPPFHPDEQTTNNTNEPYQEWMDAVLASDDLPATISTSYGDDEQTVPFSYAERLCKGIAALGARGVSMIFSSGDFGVGDANPDPKSTKCHTNGQTLGGEKNVVRFMATFPASCPFSTSVGGTTQIPEVAVGFSGGGFSDYFARPSYQSEDVQAYLDRLPKGLYSGMYNNTGRGFPDVAAMGDNYQIWYKGKPIPISGTSASAPTFASVIALLNDIRIAGGEKPLGFLNPWLYSQGKRGLNDITVGNNPGCGTPGFNATKGWDPITGLGTPDFSKLRNLLPKSV